MTGELYPADAALLDRRLKALAQTFCDRDPRTPDQRRVDALGALFAGHTTLTCACGASDCAGPERTTPPSVVVHVVAEASALDAADTADRQGERPDDDMREIVTDPECFAEVICEAFSPRPSPEPSATTPDRTPNPGMVIGGPVIPSMFSPIWPLGEPSNCDRCSIPGDRAPEHRYRPLATLADFVRYRDLTCRFPGCDGPAN